MSEELPKTEVSIPPGRREEWAVELAGDRMDEVPESHAKTLVFRVGAEWFAIDPAIFSMSLPATRPARLPHHRNSVIEGILNADGRVIVCLSVAQVLGVLPSDVEGGVPRVLVVNWKERQFAMRADEVLGMEEFPVSSIQSAQGSVQESLRRCTKGIVFHRDRAILILDPEGLVARIEEILQ